MLERSAFYFPNRRALVFKDRQWTYRELDRDASALAAGLSGLGLKPGERIGLHVPNWPEFVLTYYAAQKIGVVPLSLNVTYKADEIAYICRDGEVAAVVTGDPVAGNLPSRADVPSVRHLINVGAPREGAVAFAALSGDPALRALDLDREETAAILYTSATTGRRGRPLAAPRPPRRVPADRPRVPRELTRRRPARPGATPAPGHYG